MRNRFKCMFVKCEILGLQLHFGSGFRRENMFLDAALEPFQLELDRQLKPFYDKLMESFTKSKNGKGATGNSGQAEFETCLQESHLWDCRQLGVDSPIVLVFTVLYFNTKYFRLTTAEQHEQLAFSHIQCTPLTNMKRPLPTPQHSQNNGPHNGSSSPPSSSAVANKPPPKVFSLRLLPPAFRPSKKRIVSEIQIYYYYYFITTFWNTYLEVVHV